MESTSQKEIEQKAREKKLFTKFDESQLDSYMSLILKMKIQTDNLREGNQKTPTELAILYKRLFINGTELLQHMDQKYINHDRDRKRKVELVTQQVADADKEFKEIIQQITAKPISQNVSLFQAEQILQIQQQYPQTQTMQAQYNPHSFLYNPNAPKPVETLNEQKRPQTAQAYPSIGGSSLLAGSVGSAAIGYPTFAGMGSTAATGVGSNFTSSAGASSSLYPDLQSSSNFSRTQTINSFGMTQPQKTHSNTMYQSSYSQSFQNPSQNQFGGTTSNFYQQPIQNQVPYNSYPQPLPQYGLTHSQPQVQSWQQNQQYMPQQAQQMPQQQYPTPVTLPPNQPASQQSSSQYTYQTSLSNLNQAGQLRTLYCPNEIIEAFIKLASANTNRKLETCAILAGSERNNALIVDTLIIPTQEGHEDHCFMTDELQLFEAQIKYKVITLGWIHTHPQYSLFLSSIDLHNQLGYQMQMPEAIAIVYSPIEQERFKAFRVKDERISEISKCSKTNFHEHKDNLGRAAFEACTHIRYVSGSQNGITVKTVDLR